MSLVIFDLDGTIVYGQSQEHLIKYLIKKKEISFFVYLIIFIWFLGYKIGVCHDPNWVVRYGVKKIVKNRKTVEVNKIISDFYSDSLVKKLNHTMLKKIKEHKKRKDELVLLTNCIEPLAVFVAEQLGISKVLSTKLEVNGDFYTGRIFGDIVYGEQKRKIILEHYSESKLSESIVYADHYSDFFMFPFVKSVYLVNPSQKTKNFLKSYSQKENIKLLK